MGSTLKNWLGITVLERENLTLAKASVEFKKRIETLEAEVLELQKSLTPAKEKPIIEAKPQRVTWRNFMSIAERTARQEEQP